MNSAKFKIIYCIVLSAVTAGLAFESYHLGKVYNIHSQAAMLLNREIYNLNTQYKNTDSQRQLLDKQKKELEAQIHEKSYINKEIEDSVNQSEKLSKDIEEAKAKITLLDEQIAEKRSILLKIDSVSQAAKGKQLSLKEGTYECPKNIAPGRYTIKGKETLLIYTASNTLKISENLSRLDSNSFTFNIESGEKIRIESGT